MKDKSSDVVISSGNVFADLGFPNSNEMMAKAELARQIATIIAERQLTQMDAAQLLGTTQPKVSDLTQGKLAGFSLERLVRFLNALDRDVQIQITAKPSTRQHAIFWVSGEQASSALADAATSQGTPTKP